MREGLLYPIMVERPEGWNEDLYNKLSLEYLIECAKNEQFDEWNQAYEAYLKSEWKRLFPDEKYDLGNIGKLFYDGSEFVRPDFQEIDFTDAIKEQAYFIDAHLEGAYFMSANLEDANIDRAHFEGANFNGAHLKGVNFNGAHLENVSFGYANLENAYFKNAHLENADLHDVHLEGASFNGAHLEDARIEYAHLEGAQFNVAVVNGETLFFDNTIDDKTDFTGTSLSSARIDPELRTKLERNIRQIRWEKWYKDNKILEIPARIFWKISDYGSSTRAILFTFLVSNFVFMMFYLALRDADLLNGSILSTGNDLLLAYMQTTLVPFGILSVKLTDLSLFPVFIIFVQVIFGYTILAALVTRMAIMFQNLSP